MRNTLRFALLLISFSHLDAQDLDSLYSVWGDPAQSDSLRVDAYVAYLRDAYLFSKPDTVEILAEALHDFARTQDYQPAAGAGYIMQGNANYLRGNYPRALQFYQKSLAIREATGDKKGMSALFNNIGNIYNSKGDYPRALDNYQRALAMMEAIGEKMNISSVLSNIGGIYASQGNNDQALEYYKRALAIDEELGRKSDIGASLTNVGTTYTKAGDPDRAVEYFHKAIGIWEEIGDKYNIAITLNNLAMIYSDLADYPRALDYSQRSLAIRESIGAKRDIPRSLNIIGTIYQKLGKNQQALQYCGRALALAEEVGALDRQKFACECLYDAYKALGQGDKALAYLEKINTISDSLQVQETTRQLDQMEFAKVMREDSIAKAEEARQVEAAHRAEVRQKNQVRNAFIGSSFLLLLLAGGLYSRWRYVRKSRDIISKERDRSENLLLNILPEEIAAELKEKGRADARDFEMVSILFTDFKGFTEHSARLSASDLVEEINHCFEAFDAIMDKYGIEKIKTIGDAYMAAGGLPVPTDDSARNTVLAALEMQDFIRRREAEKSARGEPAFQMRVGIHTGPVVAGIVGVKKFQYDIWGDTVNTASRMESSGEVGKVNISQSTYELLKDDPAFVFESRGKIEAKGKGEMDMYFCARA